MQFPMFTNDEWDMAGRLLRDPANIAGRWVLTDMVEERGSVELARFMRAQMQFFNGDCDSRTVTDTAYAAFPTTRYLNCLPEVKKIVQYTMLARCRFAWVDELHITWWLGLPYEYELRMDESRLISTNENYTW